MYHSLKLVSASRLEHNRSNMYDSEPRSIRIEDRSMSMCYRIIAQSTSLHHSDRNSSDFEISRINITDSLELGEGKACHVL